MEITTTVPSPCLADREYPCLGKIRQNDPAPLVLALNAHSVLMLDGPHEGTIRAVWAQDVVPIHGTVTLSF